MNMKILNQFTTVSLLFTGLTATSQPVQKPNIIYILADDLGYGDVQCLNPERGKIATPNMDKLASQGMIFTNTHSSSSVCTPTRYGILTGRYNWRTHLQSGVLSGYSEPLIDAARLTVPALLKQNGYTTGIIGKWHLGMDIPKDEPSPRITNGPTTRGFDSYFGISASLDMPPFAFIENDHFTEPLTTTKKWQRTGPAAAGFEAIDVLPTVTRKAVEYIHAQSKAGKPFFLYLPLNSPHTPILPAKEWQGKSGISPYGDFVMQTDWTVGQILDAIDKEGISGNTLVILTSDNGCSKAANIPELQSKGHFPSAWFRGSKSDLWDGGHRIPFIVRWPATVAAGSTCNQLVCLTDLMATCADLVGTKLPDNAGEDSFSFLQALKGKPIPSSRAGVIHHSINGYFSYRQGKWKLLLSKGSGGWSSPTEKEFKDGSAEAQLYDMEKDPGETNNLYKTQPEIVAQLLEQLESDVQRGRSTAGPDQKNDIDKIVLWKNREK
jgi:arylsulfatase A-like enzyme